MLRKRNLSNLLMNEIPLERVNQQVPAGGTEGQYSNFVEYQPLNRRYVLGLDRGEVGADLDPRGAMGPFKDKNDRAVSDGERVGVQGGQKVRVVDEPALLAGPEFREVIAGYASKVSSVVSRGHY